MSQFFVWINHFQLFNLRIQVITFLLSSIQFRHREFWNFPFIAYITNFNHFIISLFCSHFNAQKLVHHALKIWWSTFLLSVYVKNTFKYINIHTTAYIFMNGFFFRINRLFLSYYNLVSGIPSRLCGLVGSEIGDGSLRSSGRKNATIADARVRE